MWSALEKAPLGERKDWQAMIEQLNWNESGLLPAIAQQFDSREILMLAWMNRQALKETIQTGRVCYWSRSRAKLWRKGESSGQVQKLHALYIDCDGDSILLMVDQKGPACHTGRRSCFSYRLEQDQLIVDAPVLIDPKQLYGH